MSDDLRTRISAVIRREVPCHPPAADRIADAVIRELGLYQDKCPCSQPGPNCAYRYITAWKAGWKADDERS